jgi:hypothetical protein
VLLLGQMRMEGLLDCLKDVAIDWMLWERRLATYMMKFKLVFGERCRERGL